MARNTRQEILDEAKHLFNERGYNSVTTRDIADAVGISKGNLTYYFKKKEEIIEALIGDNSDASMHEPPRTLEGLDSHLRRIEQVVADNAFYFWHHAQLSQLSPKIHELQLETLKRNKAVLRDSFGLLSEKGLLVEEEYAGEYDKVIDSLMLASIYWIPFCELKGLSSHEGFVDQAWSILYPLLTEESKKALEAMIK